MTDDDGRGRAVSPEPGPAMGGEPCSPEAEKAGGPAWRVLVAVHQRLRGLGWGVADQAVSSLSNFARNLGGSAGTARVFGVSLRGLTSRSVRAPLGESRSIDC